MKRAAIVGILLVIHISFAFCDTEVTPYFTLLGDWSFVNEGDAGFSGSPTELDGIIPFTKAISTDGKYFGYFFSYDPGEMTGTGSPMEGNFEYFPEWAEFGWVHLMEADFRSILEKFGSDLRRQHFWTITGGEEAWGLYHATGYARFNNENYGFAGISIQPDVAWYFTAIIFCDAADFDAHINEMKETLGIEYSGW